MAVFHILLGAGIGTVIGAVVGFAVATITAVEHYEPELFTDEG